MSLRAALYRRVSTVAQDEDGLSLESQLADLQARAQANGYRVVVSEYDVHSGAYLDERPGLTALRRAMKRKQFDVLLIWRTDRLARNQNHQAVIAYEAKNAGVTIESCTEVYEDTPLGRYMQATYGFVAEMERELIKERTRRGMQTRLSKGAPTGRGRAPYGYEWADDKRTRLVATEAADTVRRIFHEVASGVALHALARQLTAEGVPTARGAAEWNQRTLAFIVNNPVYWGEPVALRWTIRQTRHVDPLTGDARLVKTAVVAPTAVHVPLPAGVAEPLVSKETALAAQAAIRSRLAQPTGHNAAPERYLLRSGFARCGLCGYTMTSLLRPGDRPTYRCARNEGHVRFSVAAGKLDEYVLTVLESFVRQPDALHVLFERFRDDQPGLLGSKVEGLKEELESIKRQQTKLVTMVALDDTPPAVLLARLKELEAARASIEEELYRAENDSVNWQAAEASVLKLSGLLRQVRSVRDLTYADKRVLITVLGLLVRVYPKLHSPRWELTLTPFGQRGFTEKNSTIIFPLQPIVDSVEPMLRGWSLTPTPDGKGWMLTRQATVPLTDETRLPPADK